ncbi:Putative oxoglutarate/iron-dependent dioxygenase, non-hem dioxygenase domain-containing protein [Septoria linicola]|uniref:Oxoglutarate/iron-dependent dioxygenase, non-hem dioxygenase domain-containing protein n=1 Tax=Septoria linicola TaxID=215465 RepID=A0A9Q9AU02_9PEZI|nr:putative oxoglutarate/iron-dependent dioxygenase, non-hem dioxygenase domain-containing protein [Septoria linicola]USW51972.1 Putative oxoglutarate/iron-dependent dioxygenase, non-hem dioxygenase domain-containing protein [Septoria linicola]
MTSIPVLDISLADDPHRKPELLESLRAALFDVGFLYIVNHGVAANTIKSLTDILPRLFALADEHKVTLSKLNSPHFLNYSGFAEETTLGIQDLREQFDYATELPVVYEPAREPSSKYSKHRPGDFSQLYWRLRGPNQWPAEVLLPGFGTALTDYHDAVQALSYRFVHLIKEAVNIPVGTFDQFFEPESRTCGTPEKVSLPPQHRIKLLRYPPAPHNDDGAQGVGAHKDSSGWLTFLYQVGVEPGLEVMVANGDWIPAYPIDNGFVVNFGNAFDAAAEGAVKATVHRVIAPRQDSKVRYSIPFFQGLPLDMTVSEIRGYIPDAVKRHRDESGTPHDGISSFLDPRWDSLGESQLRKWIRSHKDVGLKWYGEETVAYYTAAD